MGGARKEKPNCYHFENKFHQNGRGEVSCNFLEDGKLPTLTRQLGPGISFRLSQALPNQSSSVDDAWKGEAEAGDHLAAPIPEEEEGLSTASQQSLILERELGTSVQTTQAPKWSEGTNSPSHLSKPFPPQLDGFRSP